jgi:hypothetical protein
LTVRKVEGSAGCEVGEGLEWLVLPAALVVAESVAELCGGASHLTGADLDGPAHGAVASVAVGAELAIELAKAAGEDEDAGVEKDGVANPVESAIHVTETGCHLGTAVAGQLIVENNEGFFIDVREEEITYLVRRGGMQRSTNVPKLVFVWIAAIYHVQVLELCIVLPFE